MEVKNANLTISKMLITAKEFALTARVDSASRALRSCLFADRLCNDAVVVRFSCPLIGTLRSALCLSR